jgi:hypothetical protein
MPVYESKSLTIDTPREDDIAAFRVGLTRTFGLADLNRHILLSGWAAPEENHVWNDGFDASFFVQLKTLPSRKLLLKVEGVPFTPRNVLHQDVILYFNGYRLAFWRLQGMEKTFLEVEIEPEHWFARKGGGFAKCVWHLPDSLRPSDVTGADDTRQIGFCFQSITFAEVVDDAF